MIKIFNLGIFLGIAIAAALVYFFPAVDLHREPSLIMVHANRPNSESFHIGLPGDRILVGMTGLPAPAPPGLEWPQEDFLAGLQVELFKVRNDKGAVVGAASRMAGSSERHAPFVEWAIHLPARGTMFVTMASTPSSSGNRNGTLRGGTREFLTLKGLVIERFVSETESGDSENVGRIELVASLVASAGDIK